MSAQAKESARRKFEHLNSKGRLESIVTSGIDFDKDHPEWLDKEKYRSVQKMLKPMRAAINGAALPGLLFVVQLPTVLEPLLVTKKSTSVSCLFNRYLDTVLYHKNWTETDIFNEDSIGRKSLITVRAMHTNAKKTMEAFTAQRIAEDASLEHLRGRAWITQWDMVSTQWAFIGLILLFPEKLGLHNTTREELEGIMYMWKVLGWELGIKEEYALTSGSYDENVEFCKLILDEIYIPVLSGKVPCDPQGPEMGLAIVKSLEKLNPIGGFTGHVVFKYWYKTFGIPYPALEGFGDKFMYKFLKFNNNVMFKSRGVMKFMGNQMDKRAKKVEKNRDKIESHFKDEHRVEKFVYKDQSVYLTGKIEIGKCPHLHA